MLAVGKLKMVLITDFVNRRLFLLLEFLAHGKLVSVVFFAIGRVRELGRLIRRFFATNVLLIILAPVEGLLLQLLIVVVVKRMLESGSTRAIHRMMVRHSTVLLLIVKVLWSMRMRSLSTIVVPVAKVHACSMVVGLVVVSVCALWVNVWNLAYVKLPLINLLDGRIIRLAAKLILRVRNKGHRKASPSRGRGADGS